MTRFRVVAIHNDPPDFWGLVFETDSKAAAIMTAIRFQRGDNPTVDRFATVDIETGQVGLASSLVLGGDS